MVELAVPFQPRPDAASAGYWEATIRGELRMAFCAACSRWLMPPPDECPMCEGPLSFEPVAGTGTLFSLIVAHQPTMPGYLENLPYRVGLVELDEQVGLRIPGTLDPACVPALKIGDRVRIEMVELPGGPYRIPRFTRLD